MLSVPVSGQMIRCASRKGNPSLSSDFAVNEGNRVIDHLLKWRSPGAVRMMRSINHTEREQQACLPPWQGRGVWSSATERLCRLRRDSWPQNRPCLPTPSVDHKSRYGTGYPGRWQRKHFANTLHALGQQTVCNMQTCKHYDCQMKTFACFLQSECNHSVGLMISRCKPDDCYLSPR
jgi:hypothetical protein